MKYTVRKLCVLVVTLLVISMLAFVAFQIIPGDPATKILGSDATPETVAALRTQMGLDRPVYTRYAEWLASFVTGDFGQSYNYSASVASMVGGKIPITCAMSAISFVLVVLISVPSGVALARYDGSGADKIMQAVNQIIMSVPPFFTGIIFTAVFGLMLKLFVPSGFSTYGRTPWGFVTYLFFPALAIALPKSAMVIKMLRGSILTEMRRDYVRTAYSRGNTRWDVIRDHVLRNAILPVVTFLAMTLADIVAGSIIVEQVFTIPGLGSLLLSSISNRDFPVVQTIVVLIASLVVVVNFLADIAYQKIDPRIRLS